MLPELQTCRRGLKLAKSGETGKWCCPDGTTLAGQWHQTAKRSCAPSPPPRPQGPNCLLEPIMFQTLNQLQDLQRIT
jgi:hypothetical protein